jgi:hypothetical protein
MKILHFEDDAIMESHTDESLVTIVSILWTSIFLLAHEA